MTLDRDKLVEAMRTAQRDYCVNEVGGLLNPNFLDEAMKAALAVAEREIRNAVLEAAALKLTDLGTNNLGMLHPDTRVEVSVIRAMKEPTNG